MASLKRSSADSITDGRQKKYLKDNTITLSCGPHNGQKGNFSGRKRTLPNSERGILKLYSQDKINSDMLHGCMAASKNDLKESKSPTMQHILCKRSKPSLTNETVQDAFSVDTTPLHCTPNHGTAVESRCCASIGLAETKTMSTDIDRIDDVIGMLQCKMKCIYDSDLSARPVHVKECKLGIPVSPAERVSPNSDDVDLSSCECPPAASNLGIDPILALSLRLSSILLQSPSVS